MSWLIASLVSVIALAAVSLLIRAVLVLIDVIRKNKK